MPLDLVANAMIAAVSAGAASGVTDVAKKALVDGYAGLKSLVTRRFGEKSEAAEAIGKLEAKPDSPARKTAVEEELNAAGAKNDPELREAAQKLLELVRTLPGGETHIQSAQGSGIAQADRGSTAKVNYYRPLEKPGE